MSKVPVKFQGSELWNNTDIIDLNNLIYYSNTVQTNIDGKIIINLTKNGTLLGEPIFSEIFTYTILPIINTTNPLDVPSFYIEAINNNQIIFRGIKGRSQGILLGGTIVPIQFIGSGINTKISIIGKKY